MMIRRLVLLSLLLPCVAFAQTTSCGAPTLAPMPANVPTPEMVRAQPAVPTCINLLSYVERLRRPVAMPPSATPSPARGPVNNAQLENRFYMTQNGRQMTADEFDAWMRAKGIRVATGRAVPTTGTAVQPAPAGTVAPSTQPAAPAGQCVPSATVQC